MSGPADIAAQKLSVVLESWRSIELHSREEFTRVAPGGPQDFSAYVCENTYIETAFGQRMYEEVTHPRGSPAYVRIDYTDGKLSAALDRRTGGGASKDQYIIKHGFWNEDAGNTRRPMPWKYLYVGLEPLPKALARATYLGDETHLGRTCECFLFQKVKSGPFMADLIYWLDKNTAMTAKVEYFRDQAARIDRNPEWVWAASAMEKIAGLDLPVKSELVHYNSSSKQPREEMFRTIVSVESVSFDKDYPSSTFWPEIPPTAVVIDWVKKTHFFPKQDGQATGGNQAETAISASTSHDWSFPAPAIALGVGIILVAVGVILARRRR